MNASTPTTEALVLDLALTLRARGWRMASAESCTGGLVAAACTSIAGSSDWFDAGWVTYSYEAKQTMLGVPLSLLTEHGAVSEPVVRAMVEGTLERGPVHAALAISGVAGPGGGTPAKPVGTVCFAWGVNPQGLAQRRSASWAVHARTLHLPGDRTAVREAAVREALQGLLDAVKACADARS